MKPLKVDKPNYFRQIRDRAFRVVAPIPNKVRAEEILASSGQVGRTEGKGSTEVKVAYQKTKTHTEEQECSTVFWVKRGGKE